MKNIFELDDLGIIPRNYEKNEEEFLNRGNKILEVAKTVSDQKLIDILTSKYGKRYKFSHPLFPSSFKKNHEKAMHYIKQNYGMNLSWVRMLSMQPVIMNPLHPDYLIGMAVAIGTLAGKSSVYVSVVAFLKHDYKTILHELLHCANQNREYGISYIGRKKFREKVADNGYYESRRLSTDHSHLLWRARRKLTKHFGTQSGYVFIRLDFDEIVELFAERSPHSTPVEWINTRSARGSLRDKIMKKKLGL